MDANEVQEFLGSVDYPVSKDMLASAARNEGMSDELVQRIENADRDQFNSPTDVANIMRGTA